MSVGRLLLGGALVVAGVLALLDAGGVVDAGETISDYWPLIFLVIAAVQFATNPKHWFPPLFFAGLGLVFLAVNLEWFGEDAWPVFWAAALVGAGLWVLFGSLRGEDGARTATTRDQINTLAVFSGREVGSHSDAFVGGWVSTFFGGTELDLTNATPRPEGAVLDIVNAFGGTEITVPYGWRVDINGLPVFGGWSNATDKDPLGADAPLLTINATVLFGGLEVKHPEAE